MISYEAEYSWKVKADWGDDAEQSAPEVQMEGDSAEGRGQHVDDCLGGDSGGMHWRLHVSVTPMHGLTVFATWRLDLELNLRSPLVRQVQLRLYLSL